MRLIDEKQLSKLVSVPDRTLRAWRKDNLLPFYKINRTVLYDPEAVFSALKRRFEKAVS
jgi:DNA-binding transcriptional MerR regulator